MDTNSYIPQTGDIILEDSNKTGARIVKFLMTAPTIWQHIWRALWKTQEQVKYYHVAMIVNDGWNGSTGLGDIIEQQYKVQLDDWNPKSNQIIFRKRNLTSEEKSKLRVVALADQGEKWDILNAFGKFLTWLTGIPLFGMFIQWPTQEICVCRVASWYEMALGEKFECLTHSEITTHIMYKYLMLSPKYEIVYSYREE